VFIPALLEELEFVPFDPPVGIDPGFEIGPVTDLEVVDRTFLRLGELVNREIANPPGPRCPGPSAGERVR
jgi:hypothetical protein